MVYCSKCGIKNEEGAKYCSKCGTNLEFSWEKHLERRAEEWGEQFGKRAEDECFGLLHGGAIVGLIIGIIIIIVALSWIPGLIPPEVQEVTDPLFWPVIIIVFGTLIIAGALYARAHERAHLGLGSKFWSMRVRLSSSSRLLSALRDRCYGQKCREASFDK